MNKRLVLVGMESKEKAVEYARELMRNLKDGDHIPVKLTTTAFCFETPHVEVRFIHDPRNQGLDGLRADAIYGWYEYREPLYQYAKPGCRRVNPVGLREFIVICEREYAEEQRKKDDYERYCQEDNARTRLAALQAAAFQALSKAVKQAVRAVPEIERVIFNNPATIVIWSDGTKTVVKCQEGDTYSKETGLALCIAKKALGNKGSFNDVFKKWIPEEEEPAPIVTSGSMKMTNHTIVINNGDRGTLWFSGDTKQIEDVEKMIDSYLEGPAND